MKHGPYIPHIFGDAVTDLYRAHRGWLTAAVHCSIPWPEHDVMVHYDGDDYFLRGLRYGEGQPASPCISMRCTEAEIHATLHKVYCFASILGWFMRGYVDVVGYMTGSHPILYGATAQPHMPMMAGGPHGFNCNYMPLIRDDSTRRALAFWREGLRLHRVHDGYSFLSFHKVIESQFKKGKDKGDWISRAIPTLTGNAAMRVQELSAEGLDIGLHIFESGRCAIAHASFDDDRGDPDIPQDRIRLSKDLVIIRALAQKFIAEVLGVPDEMDVYRTRNRLLPLHSYLSLEHIKELQRGGSVLRRKLGLNGLHVEVNRWSESAPAPFKNLMLSVVTAHNGLIVLQAINDTATLVLMFILDFREGKAHTNIDDGGFVHPSCGGTLDDAVAVIEYQKAVLGNGIIEVLLPNGEKFDCEVVIPVNIDIGSTFEAMDAKIEALRQSFSSVATVEVAADDEGH